MSTLALYGFNHGGADVEIVQCQPMLHCDMDLILADLWAQIPEPAAIVLPDNNSGVNCSWEL